jgi:molecular chaperone GrpE
MEEQEITNQEALEAASPLEDLTSRLELLSAERDQLAAEREALNDLLLRRTAEFDNYRKRSERERAEFLEYASADAVKAMLPVLDDFERALRVETTDENYRKGIELIYSRLFDALKRLGLEPVETVGRTFDPNVHEAIDRVPAEEGVEDQTIIGEWQRGYNFKGRLLRPAMVRVAVRS